MNDAMTTSRAMAGDERRHTDCWNRIGVAGDRSCPELVEHVHCRNCPVYSAAAVDLLDRDRPAEYIAESTAHFATEQADEDSAWRSALMFRVGAEWLALATRTIEEVATERPIHSLPQRRGGAVLGVTNVRGELLVCVSLGTLLGIDPVAAPAGGTRQAREIVRPRLLVLGRGSRRIASPVDEVHGTHRLAERDRRAVPATVARATATFTASVIEWRGGTAGVLDDDLVMRAMERSIG